MTSCLNKMIALRLIEKVALNKYVYIGLLTLIVLKYVEPHLTQEEWKQLYDNLYSYENKIMDILRQPKRHEGPVLLETLDKFNEQLAQLTSTIREDNATFEDARRFCDHGGPKFLKLKHDNDALKSALNWTEEQLEEMYYLTGVSDVFWWELKQLDPVGQHYPKIENFTKDEINNLYKLDTENRLNENLEFTKLNDFQRTDVPFKYP